VDSAPNVLILPDPCNEHVTFHNFLVYIRERSQRAQRRALLFCGGCRLPLWPHQATEHPPLLGTAKMVSFRTRKWAL